MIGEEKTTIIPFTQLTTLRSPETQENLIRVWKRLPICTKLAFISFATAKVTLAVAFCFMMITMAKMAIGLGTLYAVLVWTSIFLAVYDWLKYYMKEDPSLPNLFELDADETSL
jgi:hypothetical protein